MDKLEKALQKAKQQREFGQPGNTRSPQPLSHTFTSSQGTQATSLSSDSVTIHEPQLERNRIVAHRLKSRDADVFKLLRTQVLQAMNKSDFRTLAITSPNYGEGKTTIALNLSISIALDLKQTVLLADLDLRKPCVHKYLGIEPQFGLTDYITGNASIPDCLIRLPFERLTTLAAGKVSNNSSEILGSPQMAMLANELKTRYPDRMIIYDMPPLLAQDDPLAFLPHVDAVLLIVQEGATRSDDIKRCAEILAHANVIGTVLNDCL